MIVISFLLAKHEQQGSMSEFSRFDALTQARVSPLYDLKIMTSEATWNFARPEKLVKYRKKF